MSLVPRSVLLLSVRTTRGNSLLLRLGAPDSAHAAGSNACNVCKLLGDPDPIDLQMACSSMLMTELLFGR